MNLNENQSNQQEVEMFDIKQVLERYMRHWKWFALSIFTFLAMVFIYLKVTIPVYNTSAKLLVEDKKSGGGSGELAVFSDLGLFSNTSSLANEVEILKSRTLIERVVDDLDLQRKTLDLNFKFIGVKPIELYEKTPFSVVFDDSLQTENFTFHLKIDKKDRIEGQYTLNDIKSDKKFKINFDEQLILPFGEFVFQKNPEFKAGNYEFTFMSKDRAISNLRKNITVNSISKETSILMISNNGTVPRKSEAIINSLIHQYNIDKLEDKNEITQKTSAFIDERMKIITGELSDVDFKNMRFKKENNLFNVETNALTSLNKESSIEQEIIKSGIQLDLAKFVNDYVKEQEDNLEILPSNLGFSDPSISGLIDTYNELVLNRIKILLNSTEQNPMVRDIDDRIKGVRSSLRKSLANLMQVAEMELKSLRAQERVYKNQLAQVPEFEKEYQDILREQQIKETLYLYLLQKREENEIAAAAYVSNAKVVDYAYTEIVPIKPKSKIIYLAGFVLGLFFPAGILYLTSLLDTKVKNPRDIEEAGLSYLAVIPKVDTLKQELAANFNPYSPLAESFRMLRTNIGFTLPPNEDGKVIFVTSTLAGEGKTLISTNIAHSFSLIGKKVLLVGMDLRAPKIHEVLDIPFAEGLSNYLSNASDDWQSFLKKGDDNNNNNNFDVLLAGSIPPNPSELLVREKLDVFFESAREIYDYIIVDTAPVGLVTDTVVVSKFADSTIYVIRANVIDKRMLKIPLDLIEQKKLKNVGVVVNDVNLDRTEQNYGYGYGYGYGHEKKAGKKGNWFKKS